MSKRYRLKPPENVPFGIQFELYAAMLNNEGKEINIDGTCTDENFVCWNIDGDMHFNITKEWVEEIIEEPMSAEEWLSNEYEHKQDKWVFTQVDMLEAFKEGEKNEAQKHRETMSFEDWFDVFQQGTKHTPGEKSQRYAALCAWNACKKSHGVS